MKRQEIKLVKTSYEDWGIHDEYGGFNFLCEDELKRYGVKFSIQTLK